MGHHPSIIVTHTDTWGTIEICINEVRESLGTNLSFLRKLGPSLLAAIFPASACLAQQSYPKRMPNPFAAAQKSSAIENSQQTLRSPDSPATAPIILKSKFATLPQAALPGNIFDKKILEVQLHIPQTRDEQWYQIPDWLVGTWIQDTETFVRDITYQNGEKIENRPEGTRKCVSRFYKGRLVDRNGEFWTNCGAHSWTEVELENGKSYSYILGKSFGSGKYPDEYIELINFEVDPMTNKITKVARMIKRERYHKLTMDSAKKDTETTVYKPTGEPLRTYWTESIIKHDPIYKNYTYSLAEQEHFEYSFRSFCTAKGLGELFQKFSVHTDKLTSFQSTPANLTPGNIFKKKIVEAMFGGNRGYTQWFKITPGLAGNWSHNISTTGKAIDYEKGNVIPLTPRGPTKSEGSWSKGALRDKNGTIWDTCKSGCWFAIQVNNKTIFDYITTKSSAGLKDPDITTEQISFTVENSSGKIEEVMWAKHLHRDILVNSSSARRNYETTLFNSSGVPLCTTWAVLEGGHTNPFSFYENRQVDQIQLETAFRAYCKAAGLGNLLLPK